MIKYINSKGQEVILSQFPIRIKEGNFHSYEWKYSGISKRYGIKIERFEKDPVQIELELAVNGTTGEKAERAMNLTDIMEYDVINLKPGTLWKDGWSLKCYVISSETTPSDYWHLCKKIKLLAPYPFWIREQMISIQPLSDSSKDASAKGYPYSYTYGYAAGQTATRMAIDHYAESDFKMIVYGPTTEVNVTINSHSYIVHYKIESGEYLTIDSRDTQPADRRIFLTKNNGEKVNVFNYRDSTNSVLQKISSGDVTIDYSRLYGVDLTLFIERGEPKWET